MSHVRQHIALNRYEMDIAGGTALAFYRLAGNVITITHTAVRAALRGRGIGSQMMHGVLKDVRARGLKVIPRCPFVADFINRHPAYADLLA